LTLAVPLADAAAAKSYGLPFALIGVFLAGVLIWIARSYFDGFFGSLGERSAGGLLARLASAGDLRAGRLRRYRRAVRAAYATHPLGFDNTATIDIQAIYVPLQYDRGGQRRDVYARIREEKRSVVIGAAGAGKSLLLKNSMLIWAADGQSRRDQDSGRVPVLIDLYRCNAEDGGILDLAERELARNQVRRARPLAEKALRDGRLCLLLDGLDEVGRDRQEGIARMVRDFARVYPDCQMIVTCRDAVYTGQLLPEFDHVVRVADFDDAGIRRLLRNWPSFGRDDVESLMITLRGNPPLMRLARSPLLLTMIAYLYVSKFARSGRALPASRASFYDVAITHLLGRDRELSRGALSAFEVRDKLPVLQRIALDLQEQADADEARRVVADARAIAVTRTVLPDVNLDEAQARPLLDEIIDRSQLLVPLDRGRVQLAFRHLTLQEYLAARELANKPDELLGSYRADPDAWREVVKLWCGSTTRDCTPVVREVAGFGSLRHQVLALECLADAGNISSAYATLLIDRFAALLGTVPEDDALIAAFGAVAAGGGPRGRAVHEILTRMARGSPRKRGASRSRSAAMMALSASGRAEAAEVLVPLAESDADARIALRDMGELAIPVLAKRAEAGDRQAVDDLAVIATPAAAEALAALLGSNRAGRAAWRLAELLRSPDIEEGLRSAALEIDPALPSEKWIWEPFRRADDRVLPAVAGRIAHLMITSRPVDAPTSGGPVDERIAVPLAGLAVAEARRAEQTDIRVLAGRVLADRALAHQTGQSHGTVADWERVGRALGRDGGRVVAKALTEALPVPWQYQTMIERLPWNVQQSLLADVGRDPMRQVQRRDWQNIGRPVRPAGRAWLLLWSITAAVLLGSLGFACFRQFGIVMAASASYRWLSWLGLAGTGIGLAIAAACIVLLVIDADGNWELLYAVGLFLGLGVMAVVSCADISVVVSVTARVAGWPAAIGLAAAVAGAAAAALLVALRRRKHAENPLRRCLHAAGGSLHDRSSVVAA
jgi:hypothetical protein